MIIRPEYCGDFWILGETCCHSNSSEKSSANIGMENSKRSKIIIIARTRTSVKYQLLQRQKIIILKKRTKVDISGEKKRKV